MLNRQHLECCQSEGPQICRARRAYKTASDSYHCKTLLKPTAATSRCRLTLTIRDASLAAAEAVRICKLTRNFPRREVVAAVRIRCRSSKQTRFSEAAALKSEANCESESGQSSHPCFERQQKRQPKRRRKVLAAIKLAWRSQTRSWRSMKRNERLLAASWGVETVVQVLFLCMLALVALTCFVVPVAWDALGFDSRALPPRIQAVSFLMVDGCQTAMTLGILRLCLRQKRVPRGGSWFPFAIWPTSRWLRPTAVCFAMFPVIILLGAVLQSVWPPEAPVYHLATLEGLVSAGDWVANLMYLLIVGVLSPLWEEAMFRGFLLPTLARSMPLPVAIGASASVFALLHAQGVFFVPLLMLGSLLGVLFVYTRNLVAPIVLHSVWNILVFLQLALLQ